MFVDYSHQAYILSCNDTDYSFFGSQTTGHTGVRVVRVSGHNTHSDNDDTHTHTHTHTHTL